MADYAIYHNVPVMLQSNTNSCWYACMQMMTRYCRMTGRASNLKDPADDPVLKGLYILNQGIPDVDSTRYAQRVGYSHSAMSPNLNGLNNLLRISPVIYAGLRDAENGHWTLINGIAEEKISVIDPLRGRLFYQWDEYLNGDLKQDVEWPLYYAK